MGVVVRYFSLLFYVCLMAFPLTVVMTWFKGFCAIWIRDYLCEIFPIEGLHH